MQEKTIHCHKTRVAVFGPLGLTDIIKASLLRISSEANHSATERKKLSIHVFNPQSWYEQEQPPK